MYHTLVRISIIVLTLTFGTASAYALDLKSFAKKLPRSHWTHSIHTHNTHLTFGYTFYKKSSDGGVFITSVNGKQSRFPFASYEIGKLTPADLDEVIDENDLALKPAHISGVILAKNEKAELVSLLFIINETCILDTVNVGESIAEDCLRRQK